MDGENNGKPYEQMDDLGGFPLFLETPIFLPNGGLIMMVMNPMVESVKKSPENKHKKKK